MTFEIIDSSAEITNFTTHDAHINFIGHFKFGCWQPSLIYATLFTCSCTHPLGSALSNTLFNTYTRIIVDKKLKIYILINVGFEISDHPSSTLSLQTLLLNSYCTRESTLKFSIIWVIRTRYVSAAIWWWRNLTRDTNSVLPHIIYIVLGDCYIYLLYP